MSLNRLVRTIDCPDSSTTSSIGEAVRSSPRTQAHPPLEPTVELRLLLLANLHGHHLLLRNPLLGLQLRPLYSLHLLLPTLVSHSRRSQQNSRPPILALPRQAGLFLHLIISSCVTLKGLMCCLSCILLFRSLTRWSVASVSKAWLLWSIGVS